MALGYEKGEPFVKGHLKSPAFDQFIEVDNFLVNISLGFPEDCTRSQKKADVEDFLLNLTICISARCTLGGDHLKNTMFLYTYPHNTDMFENVKFLLEECEKRAKEDRYGSSIIIRRENKCTTNKF
ncbi:MAG: hypothetical protein WCH21_06970 [Bacteroidota bacterium]